MSPSCAKESCAAGGSVSSRVLQGSVGQESGSFYPVFEKIYLELILILKSTVCSLLKSKLEGTSQQPRRWRVRLHTFVP